MNAIDPTHLAPIPIETIRTLSGVEMFRKIIAGELPAPPVSAVANQRIVEVEEGRVRWECSPPPNFVNPMGGVHGGWAMTVLDSALGCAVQSALPAGRGYTTMEAKVNLTRAPKIGTTYRSEGTLLTLGRRSATAEARITDADGRIVAFGTTTCLVFDI